MRILLITHFFPPTFNAGTENYTLGLAKELLERGHEVQVVCAEDWQTGESYWNGVSEEVYEGVRVHRVHLNWLKANNPNKVLYDSLPVEEWLDQFLIIERPDVVHVTSTMSLGVGILRSVKRGGIPLVLTLTDFWFICPSIQLLRSNGGLCDGRTSAWECQSCLSASSKAFNFIDTFIAPPLKQRMWGELAKIPLITKTRGIRGYLLDMVERKRLLEEAITIPDRVFAPSVIVKTMIENNTRISVDVLRHGHDLFWLKNYKRLTNSEKVRFGYTGQLQPIKGVHILIEAFILADLTKDACLDIWGDLLKDIEYSQNLKTLAESTKSIKLRGQFQRMQLAEVLSEIDVLVVPSLWYENSPLVIQEAFAAKIPVITTNLGGMAEAVKHEVNGLLFERGDAEDLARQMKRVVDEPGLLERLKAGIPDVKSVQAEVEELEQIYLELSMKSF